MVTTRDVHLKERATLLGWLHGRGWTNAVRALHFAEAHHNGVRKDGITPEFSHQVHIALYLTTLTPHFLRGEDLFATTFLHDTCEDHDVTFEEIEDLFGSTVCKSVMAMTKVYQGVRFPPDYIARLQADDDIASLNKGADRIHNQATVVGVFSPKKIEEYIGETRSHILPMLKAARKNFPEQDGAYLNIRTVLTSQVTALEALITPRKAA